MDTAHDHPTVELTAQLVRIPSLNPPGEREGEVAEVLRARLHGAGLATDVVTSPGGRPSLIARFGAPTPRPALVLLSHLDVVPVEAERWRHDPFGGEVIDGELWGRGTLDTKGLAALHVGAAAALARSGREPDRQLIVAAVADEETGGREGAGWLAEQHGELLGFRDGGPPPEVLGEGAFGLTGILERPIMPIVVGEKAPLGVLVRARGRPGHGSMPPRDPAISTLLRFVDEVSGPRSARIHPVMRAQFAELASSADGVPRRLFELLAGAMGPTLVRALAPAVRARSDVMGHLLADTITPTRLDAGYANNVVPGTAEATFDCRLLPDTDPDEVLSWLRSRGRAGHIEVEELRRERSPVSGPGALFDLLREASRTLAGAPLPVPSLTPGMTDLRHLRDRGAVAYGWAPLLLGTELLATVHGHDERVPVEGLVEGQRVMDEVVRRACT